LRVEHDARMLGLALTLATLLPPVGLNHFFVVLDAKTYDAIASSAFVLDELAGSDGGLQLLGRPTVGSKQIYLRGRNTYVELIAARNRTDRPAGASGIVLSPDDAGALDKLERPLRQVAPDAQRRVATLDVGEHPVPWNDVMTTELSQSRLSSWLSQYVPEFMNQLLHTTRVDRQTYLAPLYHSERLLIDVVQLTLALTAPESTALRAQLRALGFREKQTAAGIALDGKDVRLLIVPQARAVGPAIVAATLSLRRPAKQHLDFGTATLDVDGQRAVWRFKAPEDAAAQ
jgi:hypothetical protein